MSQRVYNFQRTKLCFKIVNADVNNSMHVWLHEAICGGHLGHTKVHLTSETLNTQMLSKLKPLFLKQHFSFSNCIQAVHFNANIVMNNSDCYS